MLATDAYDAWGNLLANKTPQGVDYDLTDDPYGYRAQFGYVTDRETGLILCTYRYYDPAMGRWPSRDPIGYEGGINLYRYCGNDPVGAVDPKGTVPLETICDVASILWSGAELIRNPSWGNAGFLVWDIAATLIPYVPGSYAGKAGQLGVNAGKAVSNCGSPAIVGRASTNFVPNKTVLGHFPEYVTLADKIGPVGLRFRLMSGIK